VLDFPPRPRKPKSVEIPPTHTPDPDSDDYFTPLPFDDLVQAARLRASVEAYEEFREQQEQQLEHTIVLRKTITRLARELQKKKNPTSSFSHKSIRQRIYTKKQPIPARTKMPEVPVATALRESWRSLSAEGVSQIKADKLSKVKRPDLKLEGSRSDEFEQWEEDLDLMFLEGGVTQDDAKIYLAMRQMEYDLRKTCEDWETARGDSYDNFIDEVKREIGFKEARGSTSKLDRLIRKHQGMGATVKEDTLRTYNRGFKYEANKLTTPPALVSNPYLVSKYFEALDPDFVQEIVDTLQRIRRDKLARDKGKEKSKDDQERRLEDPYPLEEVMEIALLIATSRIGDIYTNFTTSRRTKDKRDDIEPRVSSKHVKTVTIKTDPEVDEMAQKMTMSVDKHETEIRDLKDLVRSMTNVVSETQKKQDAWMSMVVNGQMPPGVMRAPNYHQNRGQTSTYQQSYNPPVGKPGTAMIGNGARGVLNRASNGNTCFTCGSAEHFTGDCKVQKKMIELGWIVEGPDGKLGLRGGGRIPFVVPGSGKTRKELIEEMARKYGWPGSETYHPDSYMFALEEDDMEQRFQELAMEDEMEEHEEKEDQLLTFLLDRQQQRRSTRNNPQGSKN
jgi:hypothetical protein